MSPIQRLHDASPPHHRRSVSDIRAGCGSAATATSPWRTLSTIVIGKPSTRALVVVFDWAHLIAENCPSSKRDWPTEMLPPAPRACVRRNPLSDSPQRQCSELFGLFLGVLLVDMPRCRLRRQRSVQPHSGLDTHWTGDRPSRRAKNLSAGFPLTLPAVFWCGGSSTLTCFFSEWCRLSNAAAGVKLHIRPCGLQQGGAECRIFLFPLSEVFGPSFLGGRCQTRV